MVGELVVKRYLALLYMKQVST
ncbi:hypothetical protein SHANETTE_23 [Bacillus phage Shanette]|uniref:Uncharacterized protein n=2 Tax=Siminovitchvirus TaxID=1918721 RepID=V5TES6_9CAUD|nr:hypothetical protein AVV47_gp025 [Bacillus phage JL]YP_009216021.1 hypothetical protein AVV46_gp023 [Bacillus phage Shanette]AGR47141.1 hypothetical protein SHANETTE_23 [Bacillus phage Shanette]AHB63473.1 hypothetical protein JL_25 [Bacillus phage JL]